MKLTKKLPLIGVGLVLTLGLAACSPAAEEEPPALPAPAESAPSEEPSVEPEESEPADRPAAEGAGVITYEALGEKNADGDYDRFPVEIAVNVNSIDAISEAELADLYSTASDSQKATLDAFDFHKIVITQTYVSGGNPEFQSSNESFDPISSDGVELQRLPLIGFDWCATESFSPEFIDGAPITSCILAAVAKGSPAPAGVQFSQFDTASEDSPVKIFKQ